MQQPANWESKHYWMHLLGYSLLDDSVSKEYLGICEKYIEYSMTDLHGRTQHYGHILQTHLVLLLLRRRQKRCGHRYYTSQVVHFMNARLSENGTEGFQCSLVVKPFKMELTLAMMWVMWTIIHDSSNLFGGGRSSTNFWNCSTLAFTFFRAEEDWTVDFVDPFTVDLWWHKAMHIGCDLSMPDSAGLVMAIWGWLQWLSCNLLKMYQPKWHPWCCSW